MTTGMSGGEMRSETEVRHREHEAPPRETERRLWFALLAAPVAWVLHEVLAVSVIGRSCTEVGVLAAWKWVTLIGVSVLALVVAVAAAVVANSVFKHWSDVKITSAEGRNRVEFMAQFGFFLSLLLALNIVYFSLAPLVLSPCGSYSG